MEETAAAPCRATACEHKHARMVSAGAGRTNRGHFLWHPQHAPPTARRVAPRSRASSTANGRSVSPPAPLEASAPLVQSASSRSAGWTCVPSRAERVRSRTGAPRVHQRAVLQPDSVEPVIERPTSAATNGSRKDACSNPKQSHRKSNPV
jgi:hypothetical protein